MYQAIRKLAASNRTALAYMAALCALFSLHLFTGMADNGDFSRTYGFLIDKPLGWAADVPAGDSPDWARRFFHVWRDRWVLYPGLSNVTHLFSFSTEKIYFALQVAFSAVVTGMPHIYSVIIGSIPGRLAYVGGFFWLFVLLRRHESIRLAWAYLVCVTPIILCANFAAFMNTFYEEQVGIILFPALACLLYLVAVTRRMRYGAAAFVLVCFIALSKTAYFPLPLIAAPFIFPAFRGKVAVWKFGAAVLIATALAFLPAKFGEFKGVNQFHALYYGALKVMKDDGGIGVATIGDKPVLTDCVFVSGFTEKGIECVARVHATYMDTARLLAVHPKIALHMIDHALSNGNTVAIAGIGLNMEDGPAFSNLPAFTLWDRIYSHHGNILALLLAAVSLVVLKRLGPLARAGLFFAAWGAVQYLMALGDGFHELQKHLIGGNYSVSLALVLLTVTMLETAWRGVRDQTDDVEKGDAEQRKEYASAN